MRHLFLFGLITLVSQALALPTSDPIESSLHLQPIEPIGIVLPTPFQTALFNLLNQLAELVQTTLQNVFGSKSAKGIQDSWQDLLAALQQLPPNLFNNIGYFFTTI
jgi:hypothetical protein